MIPGESSDFSCPTCREPQWWTGETPSKRAAALAAWRCACTPEPPAESSLGEDGGSAGHQLIAVALSPYGLCAAFWVAFLAALILPHLGGVL
jgi:hypothetical protein